MGSVQNATARPDTAPRGLSFAACSQILGWEIGGEVGRGPAFWPVESRPQTTEQKGLANDRRASTSNAVWWQSGPGSTLLIYWSNRVIWQSGGDATGLGNRGELFRTSASLHCSVWTVCRVVCREGGRRRHNMCPLKIRKQLWCRRKQEKNTERRRRLNDSHMLCVLSLVLLVHTVVFFTPLK